MGTTKQIKKLGEITCVPSYLRLLYQKFNRGRADGKRLFFRGEACEGWKLEPSLFRKKLEHNEAKLLDSLEMLEPEAFASRPAPIDRLVMARHYDLPTRLLDVTSDPLVALYFASEKHRQVKRHGYQCNGGECDGRIHVFKVRGEVVKSANSDTASMLSAFAMLQQCEQSQLLDLALEKLEEEGLSAKFSEEEAKSKHYVKRLQHFIAREKPYFEIRFKAIDFLRVLIVEPKYSFQRLRTQSGAVMLSASHRRFEAQKIANRFKCVKTRACRSCDCSIGSEYTKPYSQSVIELRSEAKARIREQLRWLNVNNYTMMTGLEAGASEVERSVQATNASKQRCNCAKC